VRKDELVAAMKTSYDYGLVALPCAGIFARMRRWNWRGAGFGRGRVRALWLCWAPPSWVWESGPMQLRRHARLKHTDNGFLPSAHGSTVAVNRKSRLGSHTFVVSRAKISVWQEIAGSIVLGSGIAAMHYIGMAAMRCSAVIVYDLRIVALSIVFSNNSFACGPAAGFRGAR